MSSSNINGDKSFFLQSHFRFKQCSYDEKIKIQIQIDLIEDLHWFKTEYWPQIYKKQIWCHQKFNALLRNTKRPLQLLIFDNGKKQLQLFFRQVWTIRLNTTHNIFHHIIFQTLNNFETMLQSNFLYVKSAYVGIGSVRFQK